MLKAWVTILNTLSAFEFRIADKLGDAAAVLFHFLIFWIFPIMLLYLPINTLSVFAIIIAMFYVYLLAGDILLSVFGHEKLEKKRGMVDITNVHEMRAEIVGALVKYTGVIISYATIYNALQKLFHGGAFAVAEPSPFPYFDLLYYSLVTITTVGYGDIHPAHWVSKAFAVSQILVGVGFVFLLFTMLISLYIDIQRKKKYDE